MLRTLKIAAAALLFAASGAAMANAEPLKVGFVAGSLSALLRRRRLRQLGRLGGRDRQRRLRRGQARMRAGADRLGRHHSGADHQEDRRDHRTRCRSPRSARRRSTSPTSTTTRRPPSSAPRTRPSTPRRRASRARSSACRSRPSTPDYAKKHFTEAAEIKEYQTQDEANQDLAAGRIDATQADAIALDAFLQSRPGQGLLRPEGQRRRGSRGPRPGRRRRPAQGGHRAQGQASTPPSRRSATTANTTRSPRSISTSTSTAADVDFASRAGFGAAGVTASKGEPASRSRKGTAPRIAGTGRSKRSSYSCRRRAFSTCWP